MKDRPHLYPLEKVMGRQHCKNTFNNINRIVTPPETSGSTSVRPEDPNADEAEKTTLKQLFEDDSDP